jgi:N-acetylglucosamine kinase-like BadF-type ATPase
VPFFLGIDGGGTKTRCLLGDNNSVLGEGGASGCNLLRVGEACARESLAGAIHEACVQAGVSPQQISRTCAGVAGAADDGVASVVQRLLLDVLSGAIEIIGDMEVALESAFADGPGVIVIAGTGSIAYGRNALGEMARSGGWGRLISDEGSGHWIVVQAITAAFRAYDSGEYSGLLQSLMDTLDVRGVHDLVAQVYANPAPDLASLFPVVLAASDEGDAHAIEILDRAGAELAKLLSVPVRRLFTEREDVCVAVHGGVFASSTRVRQAFERELRRLCPRATPVPRDIDPALGALQRARRDFALVKRWSPNA